MSLLGNGLVLNRGGTTRWSDVPVAQGPLKNKPEKPMG
ncbi:hypothetical protein SAMN05216316_3185 [Nitrosovibrio sp. Nv6]|nr:hypothetical protein SAMN05216316_3185 [Nitrosovibrio sp. Nv6]